MSDYRTEEALRRFANDERAAGELRALRDQMAEILAVSCTNAMGNRGFSVNERQTDQLQDLIRNWL